MSRRGAALACALLSVAAPARSRAGDPDLVWRTLETDHFVISYHSEVDRLARRLAVVAEDAHRKLVPVFAHAPNQKVQVVLADTTDDSNGFAAVMPYPNIALFATAPDNRSELNDYDDWMSALFLHEYTHILHIDTVHGLWRVVNRVLGFGERGRLFAPNQGQPRFVIEGLAVLEETERTSGGRLRSSLVDMYLRMAALEGKLQRLDQFANAPLQFPRGSSPYVYGGAFLRYIAERFGADVWRRVSHDYGAVWIPGGINRSLRRVTGRTYEQLYPEFRAALERRYRAQAARIRAAGETRARPLTEVSNYAARPTFTRDGREVVWADNDGYSRPQLRAVPLAGGPARTFFLVDGVGGSVFSRDGRTLYYEGGFVHRTIYSFHDLFALDVATKTKRQLTTGLRAAEPDLSPDGRTLVFAVNQAGARSLCTMPVEGGPVRRLVGNADDFSQVYTPSWSPDGRAIAFSWWREGGYRDIWTVSPEGERLTRITADRALDVDPRWSPDGRFLYFSSDRTGVYNLYAHEVATGRTLQVTNLVGGAFDVAIAPDGRSAVYVGFVADGWRLEAIELDPAAWPVAPPPPDDRPAASVPPGLSNAPSRPYQPAHTLWPRTFLPSLYPNAFGQVVGLSLVGSDVVGNHSWSLSIGYGLGRIDDLSFAAAYTYSRLFPSFSLAARRFLARRGGFLVDGVDRPYVEDDYTASASIHLPVIRRVDQASDLSFGYNFAYLRNADRDRFPLDPNLISPRVPESGFLSSVGFSWSFSNVRRFVFSISPELGRSLRVSVSLSLKALGSQFDVYQATWGYTELIPLGSRSHVLALSYGGGIAGGDLVRRGVFFLGGYAPQPDLLRAAVDFTRPGGASLRGYPFSSIHGDQFHAWSVEYRFPIWAVERSWHTFPVYARRLHGAAFVDVGNAWRGPFDPAALKVGLGTELRLELLLAYYYPAALQLGYARGLMAGGGDQVYFYLNNPF